MFIKVKGLALPPEVELSRMDEPDPDDPYNPRAKPDHVVPLGESLWPEWVQNEIASMYKSEGVGDPLRQKLVNPLMADFGGVMKDGVIDHSKTNWQMVIDWYEWEVAAFFHEKEVGKNPKADKLLKKFYENYNTLLSYHDIYASNYYPAVG
jgi:hypothetical protein